MLAATAMLACCDASSHAASTSFVGSPRTAAIVPGRSSPAFCINSPRRRTSFAAAVASSAPAVTYAEYSPSECPAAVTGAPPAPSLVRTIVKTAALCARIAGCAFCVAMRSSSGPANMIRDRPTPSAVSIASKTARASGNRSARSFPMPTFCAPCPGRARSSLPPHDQAAPREAGTKRAQHHDHAGFQPAGLDGLVERDRDRRRGGVAEAIDVDVDLVHRDAGVLCGGLDDADVRLMRNEEINGTGIEAGTLERVVAGIRHRQHGGLEDLAARHLDVVAVIFEQLFTGRMRRTAARPVEQLGERAVRLQIAGENAAAVRALAHNGGPGAVPEQDRRRAIAPIHDTCELFGGDHQHVLGLIRRDHSLGRAQCIDETRAGGADVEGGRVLGAEDRLEIAGLRRQQAVGRRGRVDDGIDVEWGETGFVQHLQRRRLSHAGVGFFFARDAALADAGALLNPLIRRVQEFRELVVRHHAGGRIAARAPELGKGPFHAGTFPSANSAAMSSERWLRTDWTATRMAFLMAFAGDAP